MMNNVAIVTGGGRGIGRAICRRFASEGTQVVAASRSRDELAQTRQLIEEAGGRCVAHPTDVTKPSEINDLVSATVKRFGGVHVLVNCAGVGILSSIEQLDAERFELIHAVNVRAVYHACRTVWPIMASHGAGVIVNVSSVASVDPFPGFTAYGASKAWVNLWTKGLADEGREIGIRVYAVAPGAVETRMLRDAFPDFPADKTLPPDAIAEIVQAMAREDTQYTSGETVFVRNPD